MSIKKVFGIVVAFMMMLFLTPMQTFATGDNKDVQTLFGEQNGAFGASSLVHIVTAPENQNVNWPEGASFSVVVDNPDKVESIEWMMSDGSNLYPVKSAETATAATMTSTVTIPATTREYDTLWFSPIITDIDGDKLFVMDDPELNVLNADEKKPVVFIGEYAVEPGETLDISTTGYGSGLVTFANNTVDITLKDLNLEVQNTNLDSEMIPSQGILFDYAVYSDLGIDDELPYPYDYNIILDGDATIVNSYYDAGHPMYGGWYGIQTYFGVDWQYNKKFPVTHIVGDGILNIEGGVYGVVTDSKLEIDVDANIHKYSADDAVYSSNAIFARDVTIGANRKIDLSANGACVESRVALNVGEGAEITAHSTPQRSGTGFTGVSIIDASEMSAKNAKFDITGELDPDRFVPFNNMVFRFQAIGINDIVDIDGAEIKVDLYVPTTGTDFAANIEGLRASNDGFRLAHNNIDINISADDSQAIGGLRFYGDSEIEDSTIKVNVSGVGRVYGIEGMEQLDVKNSEIDVNVESDDGNEIVGIAGSPLSFDYADNAYKTKVKVSRGAAVSAIAGDAITDDSRPSFDPAYTSSKIMLKSNAGVTLPADGAINLYSFTNADGIVYPAETIYSLSDISVVTKEVVITAVAAEPADDDTESAGLPNTGANNSAKDGEVVDAGGGIYVVIAGVLGFGLLFYVSRKILL